MDSKIDKGACLILFLSFLGLYIFCASPHIAPYRDAGEMASVIGTLGVAHPPGYPLYTLLGRFSSWIYWGNIIYRINLFSAFCAAAGLVFLYLVLRRWLDVFPSSAATAFMGFSNPFWELACVSEMYSLGVLWIALLLYAAFAKKNSLLTSFLLGAGLGARMDLLLLAPAFLIWFWTVERERNVIGFAAFFALGVSVYLYLPIRSLDNPMVDWGNPETLAAVFRSATRKSYSGTLDLLSLSYKTGENFLVNARLYVEHLAKSFGIWGVAAALLGFVSLWMSKLRIRIFLLVVFVLSGPFFLFLANMPPNPHALAIVEASYLFPDVFVAVFIGFGLQRLFQIQKARWTVLGLAVFGLAANAAFGFARGSKRGNLYARDYVENVFRSAPKSAVVVFHKDVQLFSLWQAQLLQKKRMDVSLVATGLSASDWYWEMRKRWGTPAAPPVSLKEKSGWDRMAQAAAPRRVVIGYETAVDPASTVKMRPMGLVLELTTQEEPPSLERSKILNHLCLYRGVYKYGETPDFFSTDLIGDYARAYHRQGFQWLRTNPQLAEWFFLRSERLDPTWAQPVSDRGYLYYSQNNFVAARETYLTAVQKYRRLLDLADQYKSLPDVKNGIRSDLAIAYVQLGVMEEKLGRKEKAREYYDASLRTSPNAQAYYNLAVTHWGTDWPVVIRNMQKALELNPQMPEAQRFLAMAQAQMQGGRK